MDMIFPGGSPLTPECPCRFGDGAQTDTFINILTGLGLTANLKACFDAGDAGCYPGAGTALTNRAGTGVNMTLSGGAFQGEAGRRSGREYFELGAADKLQLNSQPGWDNVGVKGASSTKIAWVLPREESGGVIRIGDTNSGLSSCYSWDYFILGGNGAIGPGITWGGCYGACGSNWYWGQATALGALDHFRWNCWNMVAASVAEGVAGGSFFYVNGAYCPVIMEGTGSSWSSPTHAGVDTVTATFAASAGASPSPLFLSGSTDSQGRKTRLAGYMHWQATGTGAALTKAQLDQIYEATKARYGH